MIASGNYTVPSLPGTSTPLDWTTPIAQIIPADFVLADPWATEHITLEDALSHRTGLPRHDKFSESPPGPGICSLPRSGAGLAVSWEEGRRHVVGMRP